MHRILLILLSLLLLACLFDMPYGYYQFIRFVSTMAFGYLGYVYLQAEQPTLAYVLFGLAVLFQPLIKVSLGREVWNIVDVLVAVFLLVLASRPIPKIEDKTDD